ncbi:ribosome maturation factor RimP [Selenomonadales bacterium OttesenSCG-928-I06]|nr:ribosome maturation factor RimP [Selenomonadales bacterium OttesenSCG-928-I06]
MKGVGIIFNKKTIEEKVEFLINEIIRENDECSEFEAVDVEYVKEKDFYLRVFLDKSAGINLDDCQLVSRLLEEKLDELDFIQEKYYLEVSSLGLDRPLKKERDFVRHKGQLIEIKFYGKNEEFGNKKDIIGTLIELKDNSVYIEFDESMQETDKKQKKSKKKIEKEGLAEGIKIIGIPLEKIAQVRLHIDF